MSFSKCIEILIKYHKSFLLGIRTTLIVALIGTLIGLLIGLLAGGIRAIRPDKTLSKGKKALKVFIDLLIKIYIEVFRGTPMMVQAVFIYYLVYTNIVHWDKMVAAIFVISINTGAYMAEIIRAGIQSVDVGQMEAARSLGLPYWRSMQRVILPQAIRTMIPSIINQFIITLKDTSILSVIGFPELVNTAKNVVAATFLSFQTWGIVAIMYLIVILLLQWAAKVLERRLKYESR